MCMTVFGYALIFPVIFLKYHSFLRFSENSLPLFLKNNKFTFLFSLSFCKLNPLSIEPLIWRTCYSLPLILKNNEFIFLFSLSFCELYFFFALSLVSITFYAYSNLIFLCSNILPGWDSCASLTLKDECDKLMPNLLVKLCTVKKCL